MMQPVMQFLHDPKILNHFLWFSRFT